MLARLALASAALVVAALLAELGWRAFRTATYGPTTNPRYVVHDPLLGWRYRPLARARHVTADFDVEVAIGALGFREPRSMPARAPQILLLGDSLAFGWGVEAGETAASRLEEELGVSVWNLGVSGYGTDQQLLLLRERAFAAGLDAPLAPRLVLSLHCPNDVEEVARPVVYGQAKPCFEGSPEELVLANTPVPRSWLARVSQLYASLGRRLAEAGQRPLSAEAVERAREVVVALYRQMEAEARELGAALVVVSDEPWLAAALGSAGILHVELEAELREGPLVFAHDPHWNARGHAAVASEIARFLRERALL